MRERGREREKGRGEETGERSVLCVIEGQLSQGRVTRCSHSEFVFVFGDALKCC